MYAFELSLRYRKAVKDRNLDAVLALFSPEALIVTPLKGSCDARSYHAWFFSTVKTSTVKVRNAFQAMNGEICIAVLADYEWLLHDDNVVKFNGMSVFEFTTDRRTIRKMSTFYDASVVRPQIVVLDPV
jgi:hypothetical protein